MKVFEGSHPNAMYKKVTSYILTYGYDISPRGQSTKEIQPAGNLWLHPDKMVITAPGRKPNPFFTLFEALWIAGGRGDSESVCFYNSQLAQFLDDGFDSFHAPYGRRLRNWGLHKFPTNLGNEPSGYFDQVKDCYNLLSKDPDTRQAVMVLWIPVYDNSNAVTNDRPCNDLVFFKIRNGKLNMTVCNRSNDLHWGLYSTNIMQFSLLQRIMAACLHVRLGNYYHHSDSLHIYHERDDISQRVLNGKDFDVYDYVSPYELDDEWINLDEFDGDLKKFFTMEQHYRKNLDTSCGLGQLKSSFLCGALLICEAYILHKAKRYDESLERLFSAYKLGLRDHVISCFEFVMRKYQQPSVNIANQATDRIIDFLSGYDMSPSSYQPILSYITGH